MGEALSEVSAELIVGLRNQADRRVRIEAESEVKRLNHDHLIRIFADQLHSKTEILTLQSFGTRREVGAIFHRKACGHIEGWQ